EMVKAGLQAPVREDIRSEIWVKLWGNLSFNPISALTGEGVSDLLRAASAALVISHRIHDVNLPRHDGQRLAWLHAHGEVLTSDEKGDELALSVRLSDKDWGRFQAL
ncbi:MAG: ketopantoate reductase C-terminal domain-containing protein, partial [Blastomonas fulva]